MKSDKNKEYSIPQEVSDILIKSNTYKELMQLYVKRPFGYNKALQSGIKSKNLNNEFWRKTISLYPKLKDKQLTINCIKNTVSISK